MSTRCNIQLFDKFNIDKPGAILYHHYDGYPPFMKKKLERFLTKINKILCENNLHYWWDTERVSSLMVMLSANNYENPSLPESLNQVPTFQPCQKLHSDIEYIWNVKLYSKNRNNLFDISYKQV